MWSIHEASPIRATGGADRSVGSMPLVPDAPVRWTGEIIDPKCYAGSMKPGDGKTHKACAALCLRGGIPPVFVTGPDHAAYVLTTAGGRPIQGDDLARVIAVVGDRVEMSGRPWMIDDLYFLDADLTSVRRLTP